MSKYRSTVIQLYKNLYHLGKEYPNGALWFHNRLHNAFMRNSKETDEEKIRELVAKGEYVCMEIEALYRLKKYRALKRNYYES